MTFPSIRIEGTILSGELLAKLDSADTLGQRPADFGFDSQSKLKDEIVRSWTAGQAFYTAFQHKLTSVKEGAAATSETRNQWIIPLLGLLGYAELEFQSQSEPVGDKPFRISHHLRSHGGFHVHIVGARESLDKKATTGPRVSPHSHLQEYLNLTEHLYGVVTNGKLLRLLRDSTRLIKLSYVEFDLDRMFSEELFADFAVLYRLLHVTRLPRSPEKSVESLLERYHQDALESGARIRDGLSIAVEQVIQELGSGFLARNESLQAAIANNSVTARDLYYALLRLIYRLLFLMVAEERGLLFSEAATQRQRRLYTDHYSIGRLRRIAERRSLADSTKHDLWRGLRSSFRLFETDGPGAPLGLTGLGGQLFSAAALGPLQAAEIDNGTLLSALAKLSLFRQPDTGQFSRVNYGALATEEFGSVYERLLELHPVIHPATNTLPSHFAFKQAAGNERKTSGSYYTPSSLVECLLDSALDPVLEDRLKNFARLGFKSADQAVIALKVCDPACGSGHFLIAAAQRIARRLALLRSNGDEPSVSELRHTLREVISHCIYGVDINPMSVELCKVGLWLEAMEAGKPLSFLDHHVRCGNSLLGATPALIAEGVPDDAFTAIEGDDKKACAVLKKLNARERRGFGELFALEDRATFEQLQQAAVAVENLPDDSVRAVEQKSAAFEQLQHNCDFEKATDLANLWCAAFVIRKRMADGEPPLAPAAPSAATEAQTAATQTGLFGETFQESAGKAKTPAKATTQPSGLAEAVGITSGHLRDFAKSVALPDDMMKEVQQLARQYNFFHWHLAFPEVFQRGGFGVILGNPPWERVKLQEKEWFAERRPEIAEAPNTAARKRLIESLKTETPALHTEFQNALRQAEGESHVMRTSGLYPLCGRGDINLYAVFAERMRNSLGEAGRLGAVLPSGIATDDTTKFFFQDVVERRSLVSLFDFENRLGLFAAVDSRMKFCLFTSGSPVGGLVHAAEFVFFAHDVADLRDQQRRFSLTAEDIARLNPNTRTCPIFRSRRDADLTKVIYFRVAVLFREEPKEENPWSIRFNTMFHMSSDSHLFRTREQLEVEGWKLEKNIFFRAGAEYLPLYEAKMTAPFDHRAADVVLSETALVRQGQSEALDKAAHINPARLPLPRYWVAKQAVLEALSSEKPNSLLGFTDVTSPTNERTMLATVLPIAGVGHTKPLIFSPLHPTLMACLMSNLNSFAFDYCARQKVGGIHFTYFYLKQLPVLTPTIYTQQCAWSGGARTLKDWLMPRVLELIYTAWDLEAFAQDCGWSGPPFRWDEERRFRLRCELDAAFFHLYGLNRDDTAYILDTFPIVKRMTRKARPLPHQDRISTLRCFADSQRHWQAFVSRGIRRQQMRSACHPPMETASAKPQTSPEFASFAEAYPSNAADKLVCALTLEIVAWRENIPSSDHLDALILATHPDLCRVFMSSGSKSQLDSWTASIKAELKAIHSKGLKWVQCLSYLEEHRSALKIGRTETGRPIHQGVHFDSTHQSFPCQHGALAVFALSLLDSLRERRQKNSLSPEQTAAVETFDQLHSKYALA
ncbi:Eco57I restriction-modification methylase domain-containing protein [Pedosphaera parvula]|uniref:site-specific DNA-methyltransferase (adenine-specific) n=1 Tax=Pedosphaera parvula (strain Ellin514) TaxID=320771 RepID=B9X9Z6_PEDPL|nr:N-6 DNA methylase [Pedosphaera parvula]EEF63337.1 putative type II DNA modification enzyme [Pedosphaera parvula Ellin514]